MFLSSVRIMRRYRPQSLIALCFYSLASGAAVSSEQETTIDNLSSIDINPVCQLFPSLCPSLPDNINEKILVAEGGACPQGHDHLSFEEFWQMPAELCEKVKEQNTSGIALANEGLVVDQDSGCDVMSHQDVVDSPSHSLCLAGISYTYKTFYDDIFTGADAYAQAVHFISQLSITSPGIAQAAKIGEARRAFLLDNTRTTVVAVYYPTVDFDPVPQPRDLKANGRMTVRDFLINNGGDSNLKDLLSWLQIPPSNVRKEARAIIYYSAISLSLSQDLTDAPKAFFWQAL
ncbi:MAG: hypothetical protein AAGB12_11345 [Pseudomonadota bacterium]